MADNTVNSPAPGRWLERRFALRARGSTVRTECLAGITGFLAAAYLLVVIPGLLAVGGMDKGAATTGTILVFVAGTLLMAFYANLPFIVGRIGGSVLVGVTLAGSEGIGWQIGLGIACWSGILFFLLTRFGLREVVTRSVPQSIKLGLTASIGLFVAVLGFRQRRAGAGECQNERTDAGRFFITRCAGGVARPVPGYRPAGSSYSGCDPVGYPARDPRGYSDGRHEITRQFYRCAPLHRSRPRACRYAGRAEYCLSAVPVCLLRLRVFLHHGNNAGGGRGSRAAG